MCRCSNPFKYSGLTLQLSGWGTGAGASPAWQRTCIAGIRDIMKSHSREAGRDTHLGRYAVQSNGPRTREQLNYTALQCPRPSIR
ncbi:hypothetical protein SKAU_G00086370 [Synaphobranchus kaupii]|uniref:Uncharacterized protein n=1 Tax=Synaphobranchus kaupii TaxID=118154 RepID=A0A9Q1FWC7_SYNKA|nr:hypothetical protein SKAU_G00086370 [Synaphobranchus kaupii]